MYTAIYGDWVADDVGHTVYPKCWCIGRDAANTEYVGIDPRYESAARTLRLGIKMPVAGESPTDASYQRISGLSSDIRVRELEWAMDGDTVFQAGKKYRLGISLEIPKQRPNTVWPDDYKTTVVYINGVNAWEYDSPWNTWGGPDGGKANAAVYNWGAFIPYTVPGGNDGVTVSGKLTSYNPNNPTTIQLMQNGAVKYTVTIDPTTGSGQVTQSFSFKSVPKGTYDLVVTKDAHLKYTVKNVVVETTDIDLTAMTGKAYQTITLLCGDIDGNGFINSTDLGIILKGQNYGKSTATAGDKAADLDGNGFINSTDLGIVLQGQHYGKSAVSVNFVG